MSELGIRSKASWGYDSHQMAVFVEELTLREDDLAQFLDARVAIVGSELIGYCTLKRHSNRNAELEHLFVDPGWFRQGVGTALLQVAVNTARYEGIEDISIVSDPGAVGFYLKHGAKIVGEHQSSIKGRTIPVLSIKTVRSA